MATYDEILEPFLSAWPYCEGRMLKAEHEEVRTNANYKCIYRSYIRWYEDYHIKNSIPESGDSESNSASHSLDRYISPQGICYITQFNVETYFELVVVALEDGCSTASSKKKISALNWFLQKIEHRGAPPIVYSPSIVRCIEDQQVYHTQFRNRANAGTDPHKGLKDVFSDRDVASLVTAMWQLRHDSLDLLLSYSLGKNAGVRGASSRKLVLCDMNISEGFGPEPDEPRNKTVLIVLRRGHVHKENHICDQQVGVQRHRYYLQ
jgi:hypothetical protein